MSDSKRQKVSFEGDAEPQKEVLDKVQDVQAQLVALNEEASEQILKIEQAYNKKRQPHYQQRGELLKQIKNFWKKAFMQSQLISDLTTKEDKRALTHLEDVFVEDAEDIKSGFTVRMTFSQNDYFEDKVLQKMYTFTDNGDHVVECEPPKWKPHMDLTAADEVNANGKRPVPQDVWYSFFNWFDKVEEPKESLDAVARVIKEEIWPDPLYYYLEGPIDDRGLEGEVPPHHDEVDEEIDDHQDGKPIWSEGGKGEIYEYVDEDGNPIDYEDMEYDEDGNPIVLAEGYLDEDGNIVDEDGNPLVHDEEYEEGDEDEEGFEEDPDADAEEGPEQAEKGAEQGRDDEVHVDVTGDEGAEADGDEDEVAAEGPGAAEQVAGR